MNKDRRPLGCIIVCWTVIIANFLFMVIYYGLPQWHHIRMVDRAIAVLATLAVFPLDFYEYYLSDLIFAQIAWIIIIKISAFETLKLRQVARMTFIVLNVIHIVILAFIVLTRASLGYRIFLQYFFKLYFSLVASGSFVGFLTLPEVRDYFRSDISWSSLDLGLKKMKARAPVLGHDQGHFNLGLAYRRLGRLDDALTELSEAVAAFPERPDYQFEKGIALYQLDQWSESINCFKETVRLDPLHLNGYIFLGKSLVKIGCSAEAVEYFRKATHVRPEDGQLCYAYGRTLEEAGRPQDAFEIYQQAEKKGCRDADLFARLGALYDQLGKDDPRAKAAYHKSISLNPVDAQVHFEKGCLAVRAGRYKEAIYEFKATLDIQPDYARAKFQLGFSYARIGDYNSARRQYQQLIDLDPDLAHNLKMTIDAGM